ncbi:hypothetical protein G3567_02640 [Psychroflexus sp. YR1-1]|uniref:Apea-like HEPN domain-containing protein n=1 Tax=Psychroflexus aurantiacus TaxID=2709310 RepID=A0A6B3R6F6_9FLAO|nr:hypothetical protein [Psychroflexus aurantiacus]NEV93044.1 hypothetical protein [Psychroflexus aurantiacus]
MKKYLFISGPKLSWNLKTLSNKWIKLKSASNLELLNPYHFGRAYSDEKFLNQEIVTVINESAHLSTTGLIFKTNTSISEGEHEKIWKELTHFFKYLRYTSHQFGLNSEGSIHSMHYGSTIKKGTFETQGHTTSMMIRQDYLNSMITWDDVKSAERLSQKQFIIPVHEEILLDAINDRNKQEHRKAILYSAIAIESMLAKSFDDFYEQLISKSKHTKKYRFLEQSGNIKDPIFKVLTDRTDFKKLLHEIPLYLMGKSLLESDERLYADTIKLYTTRNKIVHWGAPVNPNLDKVLEISQSGAVKSVKIAIKVFEWIGIDKFSNMKQSNFVEIKN